MKFNEAKIATRLGNFKKNLNSLKNFFDVKNLAKYLIFLNYFASNKFSKLLFIYLV